MKNILFILILSPIIYLTSCSSGGGGNNIPETPPNLDGYWEVDSSYRISHNLTNGETTTIIDDLSGRHPLDLIWEFNGEITGTLSTYSSGSSIPWVYWDFVLFDSKSKLLIEHQGGPTEYTFNILHFTNTNLSLTRTDTITMNDTIHGVERNYFEDFTKMN